MKITKQYRRQRIKNRIRGTIFGTVERPRLTVFRSNRQIYAQLIDDINSCTLLTASSKESKTKKEITKIEQAKIVGKLIGEKALKANIQKVIFDRNGYLFHGRVKSLADSAREAGLKF